MRGFHVTLIASAFVAFVYFAFLQKPEEVTLKILPPQQDDIATSNKNLSIESVQPSVIADPQAPTVNLYVESSDAGTDASSSAEPAKYQPVQEILLDEVERAYNITFKEPINNYISLVFIGGDGENKISDANIQYDDGETVLASSLDENYFENDWYRFEPTGKKIKSIHFKGQSLTAKGKITFYLQKETGAF